MILLWLLVILAAAGSLAALAARWSDQAPRWISFIACAVDFVIALELWLTHPASAFLAGNGGHWMVQLDWNWIPSFGIRFHLALDGLSLLLLLLTFFLGMVSVLASWRDIRTGIGFFHFNLMWILCGIAGVFLAVDLFLFYFAWELMLVPMFFLIAIWGHERRQYAAVKFFLFTQLSGLLMLIAILALYLAHHAASGVFTFEYAALLHTPLAPSTALWIMLGFFAAFMVKLPMFPFHTWLPDAHTEASTAGSVILAGLLLKTGAYGLLRFALPLFPHAARAWAPVAMILAAIGIIYGGLQAYAQTDMKRLVAYTSVSHMGFVLLGIFAAAVGAASGTAAGAAAARWALEGVILEMLCHGFSTGALFVLAGVLQERLHTREMGRMNGLWEVIPRLSGAGLFFALAAVGLPGLGNFVAEFLILLGTFHISVGLAIAGAIGILVSTFYGVELVQRAFHGPNRHGWRVPDMLGREALMLVPMMAILLWLGLYPQPVFDVAAPALANIEQAVSGAPVMLDIARRGPLGVARWDARTAAHPASARAHSPVFVRPVADRARVSDPTHSSGGRP
ncbi:MAG: complex I subunit 4 family protein [Terriglobales bacterium]